MVGVPISSGSPAKLQGYFLGPLRWARFPESARASSTGMTTTRNCKEETAMSHDAGTRAVVLGGSIAGLFAARVLADAYDEVHIVDRDKLIGVKGVRRFCPQSHQANGLLARGVQVMEELFPGLTKEMVD